MDGTGAGQEVPCPDCKTELRIPGRRADMSSVPVQKEWALPRVTRKNLAVAGGIVLVLTFAYSVWPTMYRRDHISPRAGQKYPVRVNRCTGTTYILYETDGWVRAAEPEPVQESVESCKEADGKPEGTDILASESEESMQPAYLWLQDKRNEWNQKHPHSPVPIETLQEWFIAGPQARDVVLKEFRAFVLPEKGRSVGATAKQLLREEKNPMIRLMLEGEWSAAYSAGAMCEPLRQ